MTDTLLPPTVPMYPAQLPKVYLKGSIVHIRYEIQNREVVEEGLIWIP